MNYLFICARFVLLALLFFLVVGCSSDSVKNVSSKDFIVKESECVVALTKEEQQFALQNVDQIESIWVGEEKSLRIRLVGSNRLNEYLGLSHALTVGIYQVSSPDTLVKEVVTQSGLRRLLLLDKLQESIVQYDIQTLQPRSSARLDISRTDNARYLVIVAGYQPLISTDSVRIVQWPLVRYTVSSFNPINWFTDDPKPFPAKLDVLVHLGDKKIQDFVVQVRDQCS